MILKHGTRALAGIAICGLFAVLGCGHVEDHVDAAADHVGDHADAAKKMANTAVDKVKATVPAVLAKADLADGKQDKVVAKCPGCALAMEGSADHAMKVGEYELHFCSDSCKDKFGAGGSDAILALAVPEASTEPATH